MRKYLNKKYWMMILLTFGFFFLWELNQPTEAYAFDSTVTGTPSKDSGISSGSVTDSDGMTLYYQIYSEEDKTVSISGSYYKRPEDGTNEGSLYPLTIPSVITINGVDYTVVGINGRAFQNCEYLSGVIIPSTCEWIGMEAFAGSSLPEGVTLVDGLKEIRARAFYGCKQLTGVTIPSTTYSVEAGAFANCSSLKSIEVSQNNRTYCHVNGVLYSKDKTILMQWPAALSFNNSVNGTYYIGSEDCPVRQIMDRAFEGCIYLNEITGMYSTMTTIGEYAFSGCTNLTKIKIPSSVVTIHQGAFSGCGSGLVIECESGSYAETYAKAYSIATTVKCTVEFYSEGKLVKTEEVYAGKDATPPTLEERTGYTLTWDKSYTNVQQSLKINASWKQNFTVTFRDAYTGQVSEQSSYYGGSATPPTWTRAGYVLSWDSTAYTYVTSNLTINAAWLVSLTNVSITEEKLQLGDTRRVGSLTYQVTRTIASDPRVKVIACSKKTLTSVTVPDTITFGGTTYKVTNIGSGVFRGMSKLTTVVLGSNLVKINRAAFYNCPKLKKITIRSKKLTYVEEKAFSKIYAKAKVNVPNSYIKQYRTYLRDAGLSTSATVY